MKKIFIVVCMLIGIAIIADGCYTEDDLNAARAEGYEAGYISGMRDSSTTNKNDWQRILDDFAGTGKASDNKPKPIIRPASGTILSGKEYYESEITVTANSSYDYVVSLKDMLDKEYVSFYVRAGDTVTIGVPANYLFVYFASGTEWYGYGRGLMFGDNTSYSKDDECLDFTEYTWEYTLYPVTNGNFSESPSNENEFF